MTFTGSALAALVGYPVPRPRRVHRVVHAVAASRPGAWVLSRSLRHADTLLRRAGSRTDVGAVVAGLPAVVLVTTGARTGRRRESPLIPVVTPTVFAVLGTNFGGAATPGWVHNLLARPDAAVEFAGRSVPVTARLLEDQERSDLLAAAGKLYAGYPRYAERASHRPIHVFALESTALETERSRARPARRVSAIEVDRPSTHRGRLVTLSPARWWGGGARGLDPVERRRCVGVGHVEPGTKLVDDAGVERSGRQAVQQRVQGPVCCQHPGRVGQQGTLGRDRRHGSSVSARSPAIGTLHGAGVTSATAGPAVALLKTMADLEAATVRQVTESVRQ